MRLWMLLLLPCFACGQPLSMPSVIGAITASSFGGSSQLAPGCWIEIYGTNLADRTVVWSMANFTAGIAPTTLGDVSVSIGGKAAFLSYVSPQQINALLPNEISPGAQQLVVSNRGSSSSAHQVSIVRRPALFAPAELNSSGVQYLGATFPDFETWVAYPGFFPGSKVRTAAPGDVVILWGIGFGPVQPEIPSGKLVTELNQIGFPVTAKVNGQTANLLYAGLAPGGVGLYQINLEIPQGVASGDALIEVSVGGGQGSASGLLSVAAPDAPRITSMQPQYPYPGDSVTLSTAGLTANAVTVSFEQLGGSTISVAATRTSQGAITVKVPWNAVEGFVYVDSQAPSSHTLPFRAAISPRFRLRPRDPEVAAGESTVVDAAFLFDTRPRPLTWSASIGSIDPDGTFHAPSSVTYPVFARVQACLLDRDACATAVIQATAFRIEPAQPVVAAGESIKLTAYSHGREEAVTWMAATANVKIDNSGTLQAGNTPLDGGFAQVRAYNRDSSRLIDIAVTGKQSGVVAVMREFVDWRGQTSYPYSSIAAGAFANGVVTIGDRAYVLSKSYSYGSALTPLLVWIDTYDISDPLNPRWLGSTGVPEFGYGFPAIYKLSAGLLVSGSGCTVYDLVGGMPVLKARREQYGGCPAYYLQRNIRPNSDWAYSSGLGYYTTQPLCRQNLATLTPVECFSVPSDLRDSYGFSNSRVVGNERRAYVAYTDVDTNGSTRSGMIYVFDMTASPPAIVGSANIQGNQTLLSFYYKSLTLIGDLLVCGTQIYSVDTDTPRLLSDFPLAEVEDFNPVTRKAVGQMNGIQVADFTDPLNPHVSAGTPAMVVDRPNGMALTDAGTVLVANGELEVYSVSWSRGPTYVASMGGIALGTDIKMRDNLAFIAEHRNSGSGTNPRNVRILQIYDLTSGRPALVGFYEDSTRDANAVEINGNYAVLLCNSDLLVLDISNLAAPKLLATVPIGGSAIALVGNKAVISASHNNTPVLLTLDFSNFSAPVVVSETVLASPAYSLALNGSVLALSCGSGGLSLYDVSKPETPAALWKATDGLPAWASAWSAGYLYTASGEVGVAVRDVSAPRFPILVAVNSLIDYANTNTVARYQPSALGIYLNGSMAYVGTTNSYAAVYGLDIRNPLWPRVIYLSRFGNALDGQAIVTFGLYANWLVTVGGGYPLDAFGVYDISTPGNTMRPVPVQTTPGDLPYLPAN